MPQFTLSQKVFVVKSYYGAKENYSEVMKHLNQQYARVFSRNDAEIIKSLRLIINLFEKTGSVQNTVCYSSAPAPASKQRPRSPPAPPVVHEMKQEVEVPDDSYEVLISEDGGEVMEHDDVSMIEEEEGEEEYEDVEVDAEGGQIYQTVEIEECYEDGTTVKEEEPGEGTSHTVAVEQDRLCAQCGESVPRSQFGAHMRKMHPAESSAENHECDECGKMLKSKYNLKMHKKTHMKPEERAVDGIICEICAKVSFSKVLHKMHMLMHSDEKPYACKQCPMTFRRKNGLYKHELSHKGARPLVCKECGASFLAHMTLQMHMRTHTGERPYGCDHCGKRFIGRPSLNAHLKLNHPEEYPHECEICGGHFKTVKTLHDHIEKKHQASHIVEYEQVQEIVQYGE